jgi:HPt (histidine-containing phosphotransfer) domain-containing protein
MTDVPEKLRPVMEEIRREYARGLPARMSLIESLWHRAAAGAPPDDELLRAVHSLAGSAGTFGMPALGAAAHDLETALCSGKEDAAIGTRVERFLRAWGATKGGER